MKRLTEALAILVVLTQAGAGAETGTSEKYASYYAAVRARDRGDCDGVASNLNAFLQEYPDLREKYPDFYWSVRLAIKQCSGFSVRGVGEADEIAPLPSLPPMED